MKPAVGSADLETRAPSQVESLGDEAVLALADAERTKSELLDIAVHELRSPLTVIQGYAALLDSGDLGHLEGPAVKAVRVIAGKAREAQEIATTLLTVARLDSDDLRIELAPFLVAPLLERIHERARPRLALAGASLSHACPPELGAAGDPALVARIMDNLVNNAITYSNPPALVRIIAVQAAAVVEIRIVDQGLGVAIEDRERIFERFVRGAGAERASGTGLGLYISREFARRMGGDLVLGSSTLGEGSAFLLTLPSA